MEVLVLGDKYCQKRLVNLCELYISKEIDRNVSIDIVKSDVSVIDILLKAQVIEFFITTRSVSETHTLVILYAIPSLI